MSEALRNAVQEYRQGHFERAVQLLESVGPDELVEATYHLILCRTRLKQYEQALADLEMYLLLEPDLLRQVQMKILKGWLLDRLGKVDEAIAWYRSLIVDGIESPLVYTACGCLLAKLGRFAEALPLLNRAVQLDPNHANALNTLAYTLAEKGVMLEKALRLARQALTLDRDNPLYLDTLGWIYYKLGQPQLARVFLTKAYSLYPHPEIAAHLDALKGEERVGGKGVR